MNRRFYTYVLASKRKGALFVGVTDDLESCVSDHRLNQVEGLTSLYAIHLLVHIEVFAKQGPALLRESQIKNMSRRQRIDLIELHNHDWIDLYDDYLRFEQQRSTGIAARANDELQLVGI